MYGKALNWKLLLGTLAVAHISNSAPESREQIGKRSLLTQDPELLGADLSQIVVGVGGRGEHHEERGYAYGKSGAEKKHDEHDEACQKGGHTTPDVAQKVGLKSGRRDSADKIRVLLVELVLDLLEYLLLSVRKGHLPPSPSFLPFGVRSFFEAVTLLSA
jgi:hypothetical protein